MFDQRADQLVGVEQFEALDAFCKVLNRLANFFDTFLPKSGESLEFSGVDRLLKFFDGADPKFFIE